MSEMDSVMPATGNVIGTDGRVYNLVSLLGGGEPVDDRIFDMSSYTPRFGLLIGADGRVYDIVQLIQSGSSKLDVQINGTSIVRNDIANITMATTGSLGVIKIGTAVNGNVSIRNDGLLLLPEASTSNIPRRATLSTQYSGLITTGNYDFAVKTALCDGKGPEWTTDEQTAAKLRMGILEYSDFEYIAKITTEEDVVDRTLLFEFDEAKQYTEILVTCYCMTNGIGDANLVYLPLVTNGRGSAELPWTDGCSSGIRGTYRGYTTFYYNTKTSLGIATGIVTNNISSWGGAKFHLMPMSYNDCRYDGTGWMKKLYVKSSNSARPLAAGSVFYIMAR